jgi:hypothetical protein
MQLNLCSWPPSVVSNSTYALFSAKQAEHTRKLFSCILMNSTQINTTRASQKYVFLHYVRKKVAIASKFIKKSAVPITEYPQNNDGN